MKLTDVMGELEACVDEKLKKKFATAPATPVA